MMGFIYNDQEADLILTFDEENPYGYISGVRLISDTESSNVGKLMNSVMAGEPVDLEAGEEPTIVPSVKEGDKIEFLADFYDYKGNFLDQYVLGEAWIVGSEEPYIANMDVGEGAALAMYKITDVYGKEYWTGVIPEK